MRPLAFALLAGAAALACDAASEAAPDARATTDIAQATAPADASAAPSDTAFTNRVMVFLLTDSTELAMLRQEYGADYEVIADDMMWYRAEAFDWAERNDVPIVVLDGRPPLRFRVEGAPRSFDFTGEEGGDVVVLYDTDREPVPVAPIDVSERAPAYYAPLGP